MYPDEFDYHEAESVDHALELLADNADVETELLAGGHSLLPTMKSGLASPDVVVDISGIDAMRGIDRGAETVTIGAATPYADVANSDAVQSGSPALAEATAAIGDVQVRNMGTVGGNLAHADPASDLPGAALAANATIVAQGPDGERRIDVDDYFLGMYATDLAHDEILTAVEVPVVGSNAAGAYVKKPSPSSGYAMIGVAAQVELDGDTVTSARVGANGAVDHGTRLEPVENALTGERLTEATIEGAADRATDGLDEALLMDDLQASGEFRAHLLEVYTERALSTVGDRLSRAAAAD